MALVSALILITSSACPQKRLKFVFARTVEVYDPVSDQWGLGPNMPLALAFVAAAESGGEIYVAGGRKGMSRGTIIYTDNFMRFDPVAGAWTALPALSRARSDAHLAAIGSQLYLIGGFSDIGSLDLVEVFDAVSGTWSPGPSLPSPRWSFASTELGGEVYLLGGDDGTGLLDEVLVLDPALGVWLPITPLPAPRTRLAATAHGSVIYAIGGGVQGGSATAVDIYDPVADSWAPGPALPQDVRDGGVASVGTEIFLVLASGSDPRGLLSLDTVTGLWTARASRAVESQGVSVAVEGGLVYLFGGQWTEFQ